MDTAKSITVLTRAFADENYKELLNLFRDRLTSSSDEQKKNDLLLFLDSIRIQVLRFIVLIKWSKENEETARAIENARRELLMHSSLITRAADFFYSERTTLYLERVRRAEIPTAIDVLQENTVQLPKSIAGDDFMLEHFLQNEVKKTVLSHSYLLPFLIDREDKQPQHMQYQKFSEYVDSFPQSVFSQFRDLPQTKSLCSFFPFHTKTHHVTFSTEKASRLVEDEAIERTINSLRISIE